ncbi:MAG: hypothetical protein O7B26_03090 [Planctomycetota bacterium]|nr:hypothetical protein [Planctomycetota bacterium]
MTQDRSRWTFPALLALTSAGLALRAYRTDVPFHSGDFATLPYMVSQFSGFEWIISHSYGPLLPALVSFFVRAAILVGFVVNETLWRMPLIVAGAMHIPLTYILMRRFGAMPWTAIMAAGVAAGLPSLTNDARYPWGYESLGVVLGTLALWAWLRYLDHPTRLGAWLAGTALASYLLSHILVFAVPIVFVAAVVMRRGRREGLRCIMRRPVLVPAGGAVLITAIAYWRFNGGIIGRMVRHAGSGTLDISASSWHDFALIWFEHLGPPWAAFCAAAVLIGTILAARGDVRGLPALWAVVYAAPLALFLNMANIGRPDTYLIQGTFAASLAGCMLLQIIWERAKNSGPLLRRSVRIATVSAGATATAALSIGSYCNIFTEYRWPSWTGTVEYGRVRPDPGHKAAGWYVRTHVPDDAVVFAAHDTMGMEYPCATYYTGRHVAASEDTPHALQQRIINEIHEMIDVAIIPPEFLSLFRDEHGYSAPVRILRNDEIVLYVVVRPGFSLRAMDVDTERANRLFDETCALRHVPAPAPRNARTSAVNKVILATQSVSSGVDNAVAALQD